MSLKGEEHCSNINLLQARLMSSKSLMEAEITIEGVQVVVYHGGCYSRLDRETGADGIK